MKQPITSESPLFLCGARARLLKKEEKRSNKNINERSGGPVAARSCGSFPPSAAAPPLGTGPEGCQASGLLVKSSAAARSNLAQAITGIEVQIAENKGISLRAFITIQLEHQRHQGSSKRLTSHMTERARDFTRERCHTVCDVSREYLDQIRNESPRDDLIMIGHCHPRREKLKIPGLATVFHWHKGEQDQWHLRLWYFEQVYDIELTKDTLTQNQKRLNYILQGQWGSIVKCPTARFNAHNPLSNLPDY